MSDDDIPLNVVGHEDREPPSGGSENSSEERGDSGGQGAAVRRL